MLPCHPWSNQIVKKRGGYLGWIVRGALGLCILVLAFAALGSRQQVEPAVPTATPTVMPIQVVAAVEPPATPAPTATSEPFVERIISRISRATPAPYPTSTPLPVGLAVVNVVDFAYMPSVIRIHAGETILWSNGGRELHDVTGVDDWHSGPIEPASQFRQTFGAPGTFEYRCSVHPDMSGTIIVSP
jgi:plastocyanin